MMQNPNQISDNLLLGKTEDHLVYITERIGIHKAMLTDYNALCSAANADGINIEIASGFRSFERQLTLWNNKFCGKTPIKDNDGDPIDISALSDIEIIHHILLFSALPGASRHHWGCDIDVYASNLLAEGYQLQLEPWEYDKSGPLEKLTSWLTQHAHRYGFYFPYNTYSGGVAREPWHLSYAPLSEKLQKSVNLDLLTSVLEESNILGKSAIIENLPEIAKQYVFNTCAPCSKVTTNTIDTDT